MTWLWASLAHAGRVFEVAAGPDGPVLRRVAETDSESESIVTWVGRPLELVIVADLSISVARDPSGPAEAMRGAMRAAWDTLTTRPIRGDELGVTVFAANAERWVPLGPVDRPGLGAWLDGFGRTDLAPVPFSDTRALDRGEWALAPIRPVDLPIDPFGTDPAEGLHLALDDLRGGERSLKAIVVLWDGAPTVDIPVKRLLNRVWSHEIHVFTIAVGDVSLDDLDARGGGDVYLAGSAADLAMREILGQLRMPE